MIMCTFTYRTEGNSELCNHLMQYMSSKLCHYSGSIYTLMPGTIYLNIIKIEGVI